MGQGPGLEPVSTLQRTTVSEVTRFHRIDSSRSPRELHFVTAVRSQPHCGVERSCERDYPLTGITGGTPRNRTWVSRASTGSLGHLSLGTVSREQPALWLFTNPGFHASLSERDCPLRGNHAWTWRDSNPHQPACKTGACPDSATGPDELHFAELRWEDSNPQPSP